MIQEKSGLKTWLAFTKAVLRKVKSVSTSPWMRSWPSRRAGKIRSEAVCVGVRRPDFGSTHQMGRGRLSIGKISQSGVLQDQIGPFTVLSTCDVN